MSKPNLRASLAVEYTAEDGSLAQVYAALDYSRRVVVPGSQSMRFVAKCQNGLLFGLTLLLDLFGRAPNTAFDALLFLTG